MKRIFYPVVFLLSALLFQFPLSSQQFSLLKDINYGNPGLCLGTGRQPHNLTEANGQLFFAIANDAATTGLWKSDGTAGGSVRIKDLSVIEKLINVNGTVFISVDNTSLFQKELWKSDGTESGTVLIKAWPNSLIQNFTGVNETLYFSVDISGGKELWKSDGTAAGTQLVKTLNSFYNPTNVNGTLFFTTSIGPPYRFTLWKTDGTEVGTVMVKDVFPGLNTSNIRNLFSANGVLYFVGDDGINGAELWKSDGTDAGTILVKNIEPGNGTSNIRNFTIVNGIVYFFAYTTANGISLWKTDGTDAGTLLVKDLSDIYSSTELASVNGELFFSSYDDIHGIELWKSDGTDAGTVLVKDNFPGIGGNGAQNLTSVNGILYFTTAHEDVPPGTQVNCSNFNGELWKSDGTVAGTVMIKDIYKGAGTSNPQKLVNVNGTLFFVANDGLNGGELWKTNGTATGTSLVKDIFTTGGSDPKYFTLMNGQVYFNAFDAHSGPAFARGQEVHKTDGTLSGTYQVAEIFGLGSSFPKHLTNVNGTLFLSANNGSHGFELWMSDGIFGGTTKMVKDINPLFGSAPDRGSNPSNLTPINGTLYFSAMDGTNGYELWKTNGTDAGTIVVKHIYPGANSSNPSNLVNLNGVLYFTADDGTNGKELWKSDGTDAGTTMVKNINTASGSDPSFLTVINGVLFFAADDGSNGIELWKSDGTDAGTTMVKDINTVGINSNPALLKNINGILYFIADNGTEGNELWKSDGTEAGTAMVKDVNPGINGSNPTSLININGIVYFSAEEGTNGRELWKSDGTDVGTVLIKDISPGNASSNPSWLTKVGNNVLFSANDGIHGAEVWLSNGSEQGTRLMSDIEPGVNGSDPTEIFEFGPKVLVAATNAMVGSEVWIADAPADSPLPLTLLEFKGSIANSDGVLQWKTDNEMNTAAFIIERSIDGRNYKSIGSVASANSPGIHYYDFTDGNITSLGIADFYYRLKQTDIDGKYTYSNIVILSIASGKNFVLFYPNPVNDKINMTLNVSQKEKMQWQLTDNMGRKVKSGTYDLSPGSMTVSIDIANLSSGMYLIQLNSASLQKVIKVVKQ